MPAEPIAIPLPAAVAATWRRSARSCSPASVMLAHGIGGDLEHRLHQLGLDLARGRGLEHRLDRVDELERLGVEDHQLLLDPERVRVSLEAVLHCARKANRAPGAPDRP